MAGIFVSYAREDKERVELLATKLMQAGYEVFYDAEISGGQSWWDLLLTKIENCDVFLPILSDFYLTSSPCGLEAGYAVALKRPFLPINVQEDVPPDRELKPGLFISEIGNANWVKFGTPNQDSRILAIIKALNEMPEAPPLPEVMPVRPPIPVSYDAAGIYQMLQKPELNSIEQSGVLTKISQLKGEDQALTIRLLRQMLERTDLLYQIHVEANELLLSLTQPPPVIAQPEPVVVDPPAPKLPPPPPRSEEPSHVSGPVPTTPRVAPPQQFTHPAPPPPVRITQPVPQKPSAYVPWSIVLIVGGIFSLFIPSVFGIVSLVVGLGVNRRYSLGDFPGAVAASKKTRTWLWIGYVVFVIGLAGFVLINVYTNTNSNS